MKVIDKNTGKIYNSIAQACRECEWIKCHKRTLQKHIKRDGCFNSIYPYIRGNIETYPTVAKNAPVHRIHEVYTEEELDNLVALKEKTATVEVFDIKPKQGNKSKRVAFALLSDLHLDEVVEKNTVLGLNEFNPDIARQRMENYFVRLVKMIERNPASELIICCLGDCIGGWIHQELEQTNAMSPMAGIQLAKQCIISGMEYLSANLYMDSITFAGVIGNHGRQSRRKQYSNGFSVNYEYYLYKDIEAYFSGNDKFRFIVPEAEMTILNVLGKKILLQHGDAFKYMGGIGSIYPSMLRWYAKMNNIFGIDLCLIGHWHVNVFTENVIVNGTLKGFDAFAMSHGMAYQEPQQTFFILDDKHGLRAYCPIYVK